jgi:hypothetical protein
MTSKTGRERGTEVEYVSAYTMAELVVLMSNLYPKPMQEVANDLLQMVAENEIHLEAFMEYTNHAYKKHFNLFDNDYSNEFPVEGD